ncbi:SusC/RagA family TonB-linked outer membrane protein [Pedobacter nyackensis]|uniref:TonB-linked outer membrane protein, SusC/RagA family n=1 Tax=Pedobacter nyackensis TaxID=475255 RepID=A0A1W2CL85_9SPHI|nr:TonB-dependent receptor [Pedobacter nyackensis]SMC86007.1 TonB-linked outer membrane protein, SusC/RagA family [Pedobacter nyackensis]
MQQIFTKKKEWLLSGISLILLMCISMASLAQIRTVTGVVTDVKGDPLVGVTVQIKGTKTTVNTSSSGSFSIKVSQGNQALVFSYIGYEPKEAVVGQNASLKVVLQESVSQLNNVVVIGYGTAKKGDLTGSVASVNVADLQKAPVRSFDEALAGRVAGVQVVSSEGGPGGSVDIVIRGGNSITQNNSPLYVVDGFPMEDVNNVGLNASNPISSIDPSDIESIDVLKDASATAIYGARGANGVIVVTTKRGKIGLPTISYNTYFGLQHNNKRMELLSPYEYVKLQYEIDPITTKKLYLNKLNEIENTEIPLDYYKGVKGINWEDQIMRTAPMQNHNLSLNGGTEKTKYSISLSYFDQDGIIIYSGFNRLQGRITLDQQVNDKLKIGVNTNYSTIKRFGTPPSQSTYQNQLNLLYSVWAYRPITGFNSSANLIDVPQDPEIDQGPSEFRFNPIFTTKNELRQDVGETFMVNGYAEYAIMPNLKLKVSAGATKGTTQYETFNNSGSRTGNPSTNNKVNGGIAIYNSMSWLNENTLAYHKKFNDDHILDAVGGFTMQGGKGRSFGATAKLLPNEGLGLSGLDEGVPLAIQSTSTNNTLSSFLGRANYTFKSKYLFTASFRADGSSRFINNKWGYFPSGSFAWKLGSEPFMKQLKFISSAKLRTSYGFTGNNGIGDFSAYSSFVVPLSAGYSFGNQLVNGSYSASMGNADLRWEKTEQTDIGLDFGLFKDRVTFEIDAYRKNTSDLLLNASLPTSTGYIKQFNNIGKVRNEGLEFTVNGTPVRTKDFKWSTNFNISFNRNKVLELAENELTLTSVQAWGAGWEDLPGYIAKLNKPVAQFYGYVWEGVYKYSDFNQLGPNSFILKDNITANGETRPNVQPGDIKYKDLNGDLVIDANDRTVIGNPLPIHTGGFSNNFTYKNFDLNVFFQWSYGNDIYNANRLALETGMLINTNQFASYANRWSPSNPDSNMPGVRGTTNMAYSTRVVEDGSFIRLKTVQLAYMLPADFLKRIKIKSAKVYMAAQNIITWSNYSGYDPEVSVRRTALTPGFDYSAYPRAFTATLGLNVNF